MKNMMDESKNIFELYEFLKDNYPEPTFEYSLGKVLLLITQEILLLKAIEHKNSQSPNCLCGINEWEDYIYNHPPVVDVVTNQSFELSPTKCKRCKRCKYLKT